MGAEESGLDFLGWVAFNRAGRRDGRLKGGLDLHGGVDFSRVDKNGMGGWRVI